MNQTTLIETAHHAEPPVQSYALSAAPEWRGGLPVLRAAGMTLRELRLSDAPSLHATLTEEPVSKFVSPPPTSVAGFERFITWAHKARAAGRFVCFGIVPEGTDQAIGIIQVRPLGTTFEVAEWGFALGAQYWGRDVFATAAREVLSFTFSALRAHRLEARASVENARGNGALRKIGASREGLLRESFLRDGIYYDQVLWSICAEEWV